ncbi:FAD-dependent oxidoreductase [Pelagicoccus sp. SDUM812005]|uniref:FAD-dependent oxidoreductase n=1 Tax=Pelagicoccus sp. SDUM812005 TaxID=3041257 RepID=UPI00280E577D|nr:FAD-dependent oxidoreductase [Pelagicoccus sp. SDUM812005]MDQ8182576.1 FAD-dependent oxidoreductase [Pelagicoccus sp. SDUM812005]
MIKEGFESGVRALKEISLVCELVVVGGGLAGVCAAIAAARRGVDTVLVQDRPVLGGNASSEVRLWALGATSHLGNNNRWSREGGLIDEILAENLYRNRDGNPLIFDTLLLEKVREEPKLRLLLNTAVFALKKREAKRIESVEAFCSQNATLYKIEAPYFCDASGDGILGFAAGAAFRVGAERESEFGEKFTPSEEYGELLGHTIYFYTKDVGKPVDYVAPSFALKDITALPKYRSINVKDQGCKLWWVEFGGSLDTIHDSEDIKWELWKIVYGIWNYIKNSGKFPEAETLTLEWVGTIPGKRESRRFEGDYMLKQQDIVEGARFDDAVAFGGWSIDLHPQDGVYRDLPSCDQWHAKGIYQIPYRCYYSRNLDNLFLAGRIISASHVAFGSSRVMVTCAHGGQAVGVAVAHCLAEGLAPRDLLEASRMKALQADLNKAGQGIPDTPLSGEGDLVQSARVEFSSVNALAALEPSEDGWVDLSFAAGQWIPVRAKQWYRITAYVESAGKNDLTVKIRTANRLGHFTPEACIHETTIALAEGEQAVEVACPIELDTDQYVLVSFHGNANLRLRVSDALRTGTVSVFNEGNEAVSSKGMQKPPADIGVDAFEFWCPRRRPAGRNLALRFDPPLRPYGVEELKRGYFRPVASSNAWVAERTDPDPTVTIVFEGKAKLESVDLYFDPDYDHPMESVQMGHAERVVPFMVRSFQLFDLEGKLLYSMKENRQAIAHIEFSQPVEVAGLRLSLEHPTERTPAALFGVRAYGSL